MTKTTDQRGRLNRAIRSKRGHFVWLSVGLLMVPLIVSLTKLTLFQMVGVFGPSFIVALLQIFFSHSKRPCLFAVQGNEGLL